MKSATVIGAGLSGLATAWFLTERGVSVHVCEAGARAGGLIQTTHEPEGLIESAARAFTTTDRVTELFASVGLKALTPRDDSRRRYIFRDGRPRRWPLTPLETAGFAAKFSSAWIARRVRPRGRETVAEWGARVLGASATEWLLAPALQGIYAASPDELSASALFGKGRPPRGVLLAPEQGMGALMDRLQSALAARGVTFAFNQSADAADIDRSRATVICTSAPAAAKLLAPHAPGLAAAIGRIRMVSVVCATAFFQPSADDVRGFGVLFPRKAGIHALGAVFNADIFAGRSDVRSETWIYGDLNPETLPDGQTATIEAIVRGRRLFTGRATAPAAVYAVRQIRALPVYDAAVLDAQAALRELPPYLALAGNYLGRLGVSSLVAGAADVAAALQPKMVAA